MVLPESFREIVDNFALLEDWEERYRYVIDLGREMPEIAASDRIPANRVDGCVSQVWLVPRIERDPGGTTRFCFEGDSDAHITRGLIAILRALYSGLEPAEVAGIDAAAALGVLELDSHLSPQRSNGLQAMVKRIQRLVVAA